MYINHNKGGKQPFIAINHAMGRAFNKYELNPHYIPLTMYFNSYVLTDMVNAHPHFVKVNYS